MPVELKLTALKGKNAGTVYHLSPPKIFIGRDKNNDLQIDEDGVSQHHAQIFFKDSRWIAKDLKSSNGTKVNGVKITEEKELNSKDILHFANIAFRFETEVNDTPLTSKNSVDNDSECIKIRSPKEGRFNRTASFENSENTGSDVSKSRSCELRYSEDAMRAQVRVMRRIADYEYEKKKKRFGKFILVITVIINLLIFYYWYVHIYAPTHKGRSNLIRKFLKR